MSTKSSKDTPLSKELSRLKIHDHVCFFYETSQEWQEGISGIIKIGLERGEKCCYVYDTHTAREVRAALKFHGVDTIAAEAAGNLLIIHGHKVFIKDGSFDPDRMFSFLVNQTETAIEHGYKALRITGERDWVLRNLPGSEKLMEFESRLNKDFFPHYPCLGICQYDCNKFDPQFIKGQIFIHPELIKGNRVYSNSHFVPNETSFDLDQAERKMQFIFNNIEREERRERELELTGQKLQMLFNQTDAVIMATNENGYFIEANNAALKFLECTREELLRKTVWDYCLPEDREMKVSKYRPLRYSGNLEAKYLVKGEIKTLMINLVPVTADSQTLLFSIGQDITERQKFQIALKESENKYKSLVNNIKLGVFRNTPDPRGKILELNQAVEEITGYPRNELLKMDVIDLYAHPEDRKPFLDRISNQAKGGTYEFVLKKKDNSQIIVLITLCAIKEENGEVLYFDGVMEDITERRRAEELITASEVKYRGLVNNIKLGIIRSTPSNGGQLLETNQAFEEITGYTRDELLSMKVSDLYLNPDDRIQLINQMIVEGGVTTREAKFKRKDGKEITVAITLASVKNQRGVIIFMDSIVENITERKIAEEEKSLAAERLQELYQVEKNQRQELEEESAARGLFIDILGHELRTPLTPILASTSMLQDILNAQPDSVSTKLISNISQGMETLANRLEELLDVGKFSRGVFQINLYPVDLKKYFENIVNRLKPVIDQRQQQLVIKTADDLPVAMIDPGCLDKVIINLLANCSKFNPNKVKITLSVKIEGDHLRVGVSDELMEISAEEQERLFRPYHRVEQDRQKYSGAGLGLAICKQIIEAHHGKIWISSETGKGSVFNFIIPLKSPEWLVERK